MNCGVDITKISRFENIENLDGFLNKYFTNEEKAYINSKSKSIQTIAGMYSAKEAVLKAMGIGIGSGVALKDISILHDNLGCPYVDITAKIDYYLLQKSAKEITVSISHDGDYAVAFCVVK